MHMRFKGLLNHIYKPSCGVCFEFPDDFKQQLVHHQNEP